MTSLLRTLLSILADLNNAVVWIFSIFRLISNSSSLLSEVLWIPFQVHQLQLVSPSPSCCTDLLVLWQGPSICLYRFAFFYFSFVVRRNGKID